MKLSVPKFLRKWTKKKIIWTVVILIIVLFFSWLIFGRSKAPSSVQTTKATIQNLEQTVLSTGQVVSGTSLNLSFQTTGTVQKVYVKEGDKVYAGQTLAVLDQSNASANLKIAQGSLEQAKANYDKLLSGSIPEDVKIYEDSVASAKQDLESSYGDALAYLDDAYIKISNAFSAVTTIKDNYFTAADTQSIRVQTNKDIILQNKDNLKTSLDKAKTSNQDFDINSAIVVANKSLNSALDSLKIIRDVCDDGIYNTKVSSTDKATIDTQRGLINTGLLNITNSEQAISSYKLALQKSESQLALKKAPPRQEDLDLYAAQITSAKGQYESALANFNNTILSAPISGTITQVDTKIGQLTTATVQVMVLQDISSLHTESDVSEANIAYIKTGQDVDYTFDALGPDKHYSGKVLTINPASTVISGVVNYKVKAGLDNIPEIKPGMTVNMTIMIAKKDNVLAVPSSAIINKNKAQYVRVIDDSKKKTFHEVKVQTGLQADGGLVEILSGVSEGQEVVTYLKQ